MASRRSALRFLDPITGYDDRRWVQALRWFAVLSVLGIAAGAIALFVGYEMVTIPSPNAAFLTQTTNVYYADGKHVLGKLATQNRESVSLDQVSKPMQDAVIAAEDRTFYSNNGIDIRGIFRALRDNTRTGEITAGGSTITQQYVKLLYLTEERTYKRKIKEAFLALKVHNKLSKQQILEGYLNTVYYGNGAYGVQVAAHTYFAKDAKELTAPEAAALATMVNLPSYYDPFTAGGADRMLPRYNYVIDGMRKAGAISQVQADRYRGHLPAFNRNHVNNRYGGPNGFVLKMVENELHELQFSDSVINGNGLHVITTISYKAQHAAFDAFNRVSPKIRGLNHALVSITPGRGAVRALYGGPNYLSSQLNWATLPTQPGSTFKIFGVVAALEDGFSLKTALNGNSPMRMPDGSTVENEDEGTVHGKSFGNIPLTEATANSVNTAFLDLERQLGGGQNTFGTFARGATKVLDVAAALGLPPTALDRYKTKVPVTIIGYAPVAPISMANAYATIAAGGKHADWYLVERVTSRAGALLHQHEVKTEQVIPADVAGDTLVDMQGVVKKGTGVNAKTICPTAGKTGTATHGVGQDQHVSSSWFIGSTPKLTTAVMYNRGIGNESLQAILPNAYFGANYPSKTFRAMMDETLHGTQCGKFPPPGNIKGDKGKEFATTPKCPKNYELQGDTCVLNPDKVVCPDGQVKNPDTNKCEPITKPIDCNGVPLLGALCPSPTPTPTPSPPTDYSQYGNQGVCTAHGGIWTDGTPGYCSAPP